MYLELSEHGKIDGGKIFSFLLRDQRWARIFRKATAAYSESTKKVLSFV